MEIENDKLYKLSEIAELTGIPHSTLRLYARAGDVKTTRIGKLWRVRGGDILEMLGRRAEQKEQKEDDSPLWDSDETAPEPPENVYDVECAAAELIEKLIGREPTDEERNDLLDFIRLFMRVSRTVSPEDIDKYADFEH